MKSVLISIQPKWCELIANGKKIVEVKELYCICSNDEKGKTLSIDNGVIQYSIPMEKIVELFL